MGVAQVQGVDHDSRCLTSAAAEREVISSLSIALVSREGARPPGFPTQYLRVTGDPSAVCPSDDVVICYGDTPSNDVMELYRNRGNDMPAALAVARRFNPQDVVNAIKFGATSYVVLSQNHHDPCLAAATICTARKQVYVSPIAAAEMLRYLRRTNFPLLSQPASDGDLSPRERQIMELLVIGRTVSDIADQLSLTGGTIRNNLCRIYAKLQVRGKSEAILLWLGSRKYPGRAQVSS